MLFSFIFISKKLEYVQWRTELMDLWNVETRRTCLGDCLNSLQLKMPLGNYTFQLLELPFWCLKLMTTLILNAEFIRFSFRVLTLWGILTIVET